MRAPGLVWLQKVDRVTDGCAGTALASRQTLTRCGRAVGDVWTRRRNSFQFVLLLLLSFFKLLPLLNWLAFISLWTLYKENNNAVGHRFLTLGWWGVGGAGRLYRIFLYCQRSSEFVFFRTRSNLLSNWLCFEPSQNVPAKNCHDCIIKKYLQIVVYSFLLYFNTLGIPKV